MGMIISPPSVIDLLNEAEITHGKTIPCNFEILPKPVQQKLFDYAKSQGMTEEQMKAMISAESHHANELLPDPLNGGQHKQSEWSIHGKDSLDGLIMHELESYDKAVDEAILSSEDIVKAYNNFVEGKFNEAATLVEKYQAVVSKFKADGDEESAEKDAKKLTTRVMAKGVSLPVSLIQELCIDTEEMEELGISKNDIKKAICDAAYQPADNPEQVKAIVNARIKYNNTVISFFKNMLQINYNILGLSKDEAMALSGKLSSPSQSQSHKAIKDVKAIIVKNSSKYKIGKCSYDFRPLGLGCMFMTEEDVGDIEKTVQLDRMIQMLTQYDAIVVGHGDSSSPEVDRLRKQLLKDTRKVNDDRNARQDKETQKIRDEITEIVENDYLNSVEGKKIRARIKQLEKLLEGDVRFDHTEAGMQLLKNREQCYQAYFDDILNSDLKKQYEDAKKLYAEECDKYYDARYAANDEIWKLTKELNAKLDGLRQKAHAGETDDDVINDLLDKIKEVDKKYAEEEYRMLDKMHKDAIRAYKKLDDRGNTKWTIQPVHTLKAGPFTDVNDLVRQLIKEGFKNINLVSCNPGRHSLAKDIRDTKGVKIHHATTSLLAESAYYYNSGDYLVESIFAEVDQNIKDTYKHLLDISEESNIPLWDDDYLDECVQYCNSSEYLSSLNEGVLAQAWAKLKELVKKALSAIVGLFKKLLELVGKIIGKIKDFFKKIFGSDKFEKKLVKPIKTGAIIVENASLQRKSVSSWEEFQNTIVRSCEKITSKIKETEAKQVRNMQEIERFTEQKAKSVNESTNKEMDKLLSMIL